MKRLLTIAMLIAVVISSQAQRKTKSTLCPGAVVYENKDFVKKDFKKLVVKTSLTDPASDKKVIAEFDDLKLPMVSWLTLFPPVKDYTPEDESKILSENGIDGMIVLENKGDATQTSMGNTYKGTKYELYLMDVATRNKAIVFIGTSALGAISSATAPDKTAIKFARNSVRDIGSYLTGKQ